jgi:hypothetical protein
VEKDTAMTTTKKPTKTIAGKGRATTGVGQVLPSGTKDPKSGIYEVIGPRQLKQADKMLTRIERKGEALSASADKLLRRVS